MEGTSVGCTLPNLPVAPAHPGTGCGSFADFWTLGGRAERHKASTLPPSLELSDQSPGSTLAEEAKGSGAGGADKEAGHDHPRHTGGMVVRMPKSG